MIKILIADDHSIVRKGLTQIVEDVPDMLVSGEAASGQEILQKIRKYDYDVVVLDISLPGMTGLDVLKQIKVKKSNLSVLMLSIHPEEQYAVRALKAGASGYLTKDRAPDELIAAIRKAYDGSKYVSSSLAEKLALDLETGRLPHEGLSDREFQVMCMIAKGKAIKDIGEELYLSPKTVSTYRSRLLVKMKIKNNEELTRYALNNRLID